MTRTQTRRLAFELLYSIEIQKVQGKELEEQIAIFIQEQEIEKQEAKSYIADIINGIENNKEEIVLLISKNLKEKWDITRISKINLTLLKLAIYEIKYNQLPYKVVVNEVVELAKQYGDDNSKSFVNGILANIIKQIIPANEE